MLFDLLGTGLVTVHPKTSADAFAFKDRELTAWRFGSIRRQLSPSCQFLVDRLRSMNGTIPALKLSHPIDRQRRGAQRLAPEFLQHRFPDDDRDASGFILKRTTR
ncbi:hypothetical protein [Paraburkholderia sp. J7]|uniref:hypothetical protein n=1 Tax=Paraburkholderia sp. J7 TaxID=2805438 RepID=UPI002AB655DD|nr:hypothetical protein [Paraburkholderia sp. J7]